MRHIIPISGKDSLATAIVQIKRRPELNYEFMFNPTGAELPPVFEWIAKVEKYLGKEIIQVGDDLREIIIDKGYFLPGHKSRYCTKEAKIRPMEKYLGKDDVCYVYYGIRADEQHRTGYVNPSGLIVPVMPLIEEGINLEGVYEIILTHGLKPPTFFWQSVFDAVAKRVGGAEIIYNLLKPWQIDVLFAWRSRANCSFCFFQAIYEWVGLLEHYPHLFWDAESFEHKGSDGIYHWCRHYSLQEIADKAPIFKKKRIDKIVKLINKMKQGTLIFSDFENELHDMLAQSSCGLFCGK